MVCSFMENSIGMKRVNNNTKNSLTIFDNIKGQECSSSVVECLTWDPGIAGSSLTGGTALCPYAKHFILCLVQVQPRKNVLT